MKDWLGKWYNKYAVLALSATIGVGGYEAICWSKLTASDWGTWMGATFTGLAFGGTIWIATTSERRRRQERTDLAHVMAAAFIERLNLARSRLAHVDQYLSSRIFKTTMLEANPDSAIAMASYCLDFLKDFPTWTSEELLAATPLKKHCSSHIAAAVGRLEGLRTLWEIARDKRVLAEVGIQSHMKETISGLGTAILSLDIAIDVCEEVVQPLNDDVSMRFDQQER